MVRKGCYNVTLKMTFNLLNIITVTFTFDKKWNQHLNQKERQPRPKDLKNIQHSVSVDLLTIPASSNWFQQPESRGSSETAAEKTGLLMRQRLHQASVVCEDGCSLLTETENDDHLM